MLLENVASLAKGLNISLHVAEVAYSELEARCLRNYEAMLKDAAAKTSELRTRLKLLGGDPAQIPLVPDVQEEMKNRYLATVEALKQTFLVTPTPQLQTPDLLKMAIACELAFEEGDKGFRDTVIFLSAAEEVKNSPKPITALFVSRDKVFREKKEFLESWASSHGASISLCETLKEIERALEHRQTSRIQEQIESDREALVAALDQHLSDVQIWLDQNVEFWNWQIVPFKIYRAQVLRLLSATPQYGSNRSEGADVKLSLTVEVTLLGSYLETVPPPSVLKVTQPARTAETLWATGQDFTIPTLRRVVGKYVAVIEIDAEAIFEDGNYSAFKFLSARVDWSPTPVALLR